MKKQIGMGLVGIVLLQGCNSINYETRMEKENEQVYKTTAHSMGNGKTHYIKQPYEVLSEEQIYGGRK